ncbi:MAG: hypothetical protein ABIQ02_04580 [Saprospiraceae bacterium]
MMKTQTETQKKSIQWSVGVHVAILLLGFLPFAHQMAKVEPEEFLVELGYQEIPQEVMAGSEGLQAKSPVFNETPEPTTDKPTVDPVPVDKTDPAPETTIAEDNSQVTSDVVTNDDTEVTASPTNDSGTDQETHADGGGQGSPIEGNQSGAATSGDGGGGDGLEGNGVITRRVIYREDISKAAKVNGRITLNICINRQGKVVSVAYDPDKTTITDNDLINQASHMAARYRFEQKYSAPIKECGQLTFIFRIEKPVVAEFF